MATVTLDARHAGIPSDDRSAFALFEAWLVVVATLCSNGAVSLFGGGLVSSRRPIQRTLKMLASDCCRASTTSVAPLAGGGGGGGGSRRRGWLVNVAY